MSKFHQNRYESVTAYYFFSDSNKLTEKTVRLTASDCVHSELSELAAETKTPDCVVCCEDA